MSFSDTAKVGTAFLTILLALVYWYFRNHSSFWKKKQVLHTKPKSFLRHFRYFIGQRNCLDDLRTETYQEFKGERFAGFWRFFTPTLLVIDPELVRQILVKDFPTWPDRGSAYNRDVDPLSAHLVFVDGKEWKWLRRHLSPAFTPSRLKLMYTRLLECTDDLEKYLDNVAATGGVVEAVDMFCRFTTDVVGWSAAGMKLNSLSKGDDTFYGTIRAEMMESIFRKRFIFFMQICFTGLYKFLQLSIVRKSFTKFFLKVIKENCEFRDKNHVQRNDYLDLVRKMINTDRTLGEDDIEFDEKLVAAQMLEPFSGALESTPLVISYCLHELAVNEEIQDRLREEVHRTKAAHDGEITWDAVHQMEYLDMVVKETLRKYPPVFVLLRKSVEPYRIPGTDVDLPAGSSCDIPVYAIHHDPAFYPDPEKFDPERFTPEATSQRPACTFLPFGTGPRNCLGLRFADHQVKVGVFKVVDKFRISLCEKSRNPLEFVTDTDLLIPEGGNWLKISRN